MRTPPIVFLLPTGALAVAGATALALAGCDGPDTGPPIAPIAEVDAAAPPGALLALGERSARARGCSSCHDGGDGTLAGRDQPLPGTAAFPSNLTPDSDTGLGAWSDDQIERAVREGVDDQGAPLCALMPRYAGMDQGELLALVAYLRSLPAVRRVVPPSRCAAERADLAVPLEGGPGGPPPDAAGVDLAAPIDLAVAADAALDLASGCGPRINELQTVGAVVAADQFVELYNPCPFPVALDGHRLVYRSAAGVVDLTLAHLDGLRLRAGGLLLAASAAFPVAADVEIKARMAAHGGGVALRDPRGIALDSLGWGDARNALLRGTPAPAPDAGRSLARIPDGHDSGDSARDFSLAVPTPGRKNR